MSTTIDTSRDHLAAVLRVSRAFADRTAKDVASSWHVSPRTFTRMEDGETHLDREQVLEFAAACGVPEWFVDGGWGGYVNADEYDDDLRTRLGRLEDEMAAARLLGLADVLAALRQRPAGRRGAATAQ